MLAARVGKGSGPVGRLAKCGGHVLGEGMRTMCSRTIGEQSAQDACPRMTSARMTSARIVGTAGDATERAGGGRRLGVAGVRQRGGQA